MPPVSSESIRLDEPQSSSLIPHLADSEEDYSRVGTSSTEYPLSNISTAAPAAWMCNNGIPSAGRTFSPNTPCLVPDAWGLQMGSPYRHGRCRQSNGEATAASACRCSRLHCPPLIDRPVITAGSPPLYAGREYRLLRDVEEKWKKGARDGRSGRAYERRHDEAEMKRERGRS
jgi:hypothetical protein